jgi:hypothetical protein
MRTACRVVMLLAVCLLVVILWTPTAAEANCEFTTFGLECYYTINAWCDATYSCWALKQTLKQGIPYDEYVNIWPARLNYNWCYVYYQNTGQTQLVNSVAACNPTTLG